MVPNKVLSQQVGVPKDAASTRFLMFSRELEKIGGPEECPGVIHLEADNIADRLRMHGSAIIGPLGLELDWVWQRSTKRFAAAYSR